MNRITLSALGLNFQVNEQTVTAAALQTDIPNERGIARKSLTPSKKVSAIFSKPENKA